MSKLWPLCTGGDSEGGPGVYPPLEGSGVTDQHGG